MVDFVDINGAHLAYRIAGPENARLMITLHGGRGQGTHHSDFSVYSKLSDKIRVVSFDYRGHGQSSRTKPYTFEQLVDDIEAVRQHFVKASDEQVIICGGSFGGFLALHYVIKYASRVSHLILRGTAASHHHEKGAIETLRKTLHLVPSFSERMLREKIFGTGLESDIEFRLVSFAMAPLYKDVFDSDAALKNALAGAYNAGAHNDLYSKEEKYFDYTKDLHKISARTLVVVGKNDWICPPENSELLAAKIPDAELLVVENANHGVHLDKPELVLTKIKELLRL